jgi:protein TonB
MYFFGGKKSGSPAPSPEVTAQPAPKVQPDSAGAAPPVVAEPASQAPASAPVPPPSKAEPGPPAAAPRSAPTPPPASLPAAPRSAAPTRSERAAAEAAPLPAQRPAAAPPPASPRVEPVPEPTAAAPAAAPAAPPQTAPEPAPQTVVIAPAAAPAAEPAAPPAALKEESAPRYAGDGFQAPHLVVRTCLSDNLRLPAQLDGAMPDQVTVRLAVSATGEASRIQVMGQVADPRITEAVRRAVQACEWVPGADAQGKPTALWVVQPLRLSR